MPSFRRRIVAAALVSVAVVLGWFALRSPSAASGTTTPGGGTPVLSARRLPQVIGDTVAAPAVDAALDEILAGTESCVVAGDAAGTFVVRSPDTPLTPASTEKLLTATAALESLGPDFRFETRAVASGAPRDGSVERLYLVGAGDPVLATPDYQAWVAGQAKRRDDVTTPLADLADAIVAAGVKRVPGGIVADESRYEALRYVPSWRDSYRTEGEVGPLGALTVNDGFSQYRGRTVPAPDPATLAADQLAALLEERGVTVGPSTNGRAPADATGIASVHSAPLSEVVASMLRSSDNYTAELLTRELAVHAGTQPGTTEAGAAATEAELERIGVSAAGIEMRDGSGLDRADAATCRALDGVLMHARSGSRTAAVDQGLAVAGRTGTLAERFAGTPLAARLRAKTGTLNGVTGLAGVIDGPRPIVFSMIANGAFGQGQGFALQQQVAGALDAFTGAAADGAARVPPPR